MSTWEGGAGWKRLCCNYWKGGWGNSLTIGSVEDFVNTWETKRTGNLGVPAVNTGILGGTGVTTRKLWVCSLTVEDIVNTWITMKTRKLRELAVTTRYWGPERTCCDYPVLGK